MASKTFDRKTYSVKFALREKCPNTEFFLVRIQSEYRKIRTRNNSVFGRFSRSIREFIYNLTTTIVDKKIFPKPASLVDTGRKLNEHKTYRKCPRCPGRGHLP